jgi:DNA-binding CsgD family transcriptional regulator
VVVEPAKSAEIAPIIVEAYALSPREREVVRALARGLATPEIAAALFLSPHTVRDYVKSVFEKTGVSSRGELIEAVRRALLRRLPRGRRRHRGRRRLTAPVPAGER